MNRFHRLAALAFMAAFFLSFSMGALSLSRAGLPGCGMGSGCASVLSSPWAWVGPVPVAWLGALVYALAGFSVLGRGGPWLVRWSRPMLGAVVAGALFFLLLQAWVLGQWCPWCCAAHALALTGTMAALGGADAGRVSRRKSGTGAGMLTGAVAGLALLSTALLAVPGKPEAGAFVVAEDQPAPEIVAEDKAPAPAPPDTPENPAAVPPRVLRLRGGEFEFALADLPRLGAAEARRHLVAITDPTCPHCRVAEQRLKEVLWSYPEGELAIHFLPGTRDPLISPALQRLQLALWRAAPEAWGRLWEEEGFTYENAASLDRLRALVAEKVGGVEGLDRLLREHEAADGELLRRTSALAEANARATGRELALPQLMAGTAVTFGAPDFRDLDTLLVAQLGLEKPALAADPDDPCEAKFRRICGRLIISMIGAGEEPRALSPAHTHLASDIFEYNAQAHLKQFSPKGGALPVHAIAFSSDAGFNSKAPNFFGATNGNFVGTHPISADTFSQTLSADAQKSHIQKAIEEFEKKPECQKLKKEHDLENITPLLKVEVIIDGHYTDRSGHASLSAWRHSHETGTFAQWQQSNMGFFQKEHWKMLADTLQGAVIQTFNTACRSADMARTFEKYIDEKMPNAQCSCYVAAASKNQDEYGYSGDTPFLNSAINNEGRSIRNNLAAANNWDGAPSAAKMLPKLYNKHKTAILTPLNTPAGRPLIPLFASAEEQTKGTKASYSRNPLMGFVWTSADAVAEEALERLSSVNQSVGTTARGILNAQYMHEMPANLPQSVSASGAVKDDYERVMAHIAQMERSYQPTLSDPQRRLDSTFFDREYGNFSDCYNGKTNKNCEVMLKYMDEIGDGARNSEERAFNKSKDDFIGALVNNKPREIWKGYVAGQKPLADVFLGLDEMWYAYEKFKQNLSAVAFNRSGDARQVPAGVEAAFNHMTESFEKAYASIQTQVFEELRNEAIKVKLARMRQAANMLAQNAGSMPNRYAERTLKDMASKLNCLTQYPVGPALDARGPGPVLRGD